MVITTKPTQVIYLLNVEVWVEVCAEREGKEGWAEREGKGRVYV